MDSFGDIVLVLSTVLISLALLVLSLLAIFKTNALLRFNLKYFQKRYLNSLKRKSFLSKNYQKLTKFNYELAKRNSNQKWIYYNIKICGVAALFMAILFLAAIIHGVFDINFGVFTK